MTQAPVVLRLSGLSKRFGAVQANEAVSLDLRRGEILALLGENGAGKTTLMNMLFGHYLPDAGSVEVADRDGRLAALPLGQPQAALSAGVGMVHQHFTLAENLTAFENVEYVLALQGVPGAERRERAMEALKWVGLEAQADRRPDLLSGGQQQRVAVARSIVHRPMVVLADEPTANLDSKTAESLLELMARLNQEHGVTFLFSSHDPRVLERARRVVEILDGKLQQ